MAANMTFKADLLPNTDLGYSLGSSNKRWKINGINLDSTYVQKSGDTMTGYLTINMAGAGVIVKNSTINAIENTNGRINLTFTDNGNQGLWSSGYYNGTAYVDSSKWLIYRGTDGNVIVNGNASTASAISPAGTTAQFWRGDNSWSDTLTGTLTLTRTQDASGVADNKPALIVGGSSTAQHIEIDNNEILSKSNGTTPGTLYLQDNTGTVQVAGSGGLKVWDLTIAGDATTDMNKRTIKSSSTLYFDRGADTSLLFLCGGSAKIRIDGSNNFRPETTNTCSLGSSSYRWATCYIGTANSYGSETQPIYWSNGVPTAANAYSTLLTAFSTSTNTISITVGGTTKTTSAVTGVSNAWTAGTTAGPKIKTTVNGVAGSEVAIPSATASASGIVTTTTQTFAGNKTFNGTITIANTSAVQHLLFSRTGSYNYINVPSDASLAFGSAASSAGTWVRLASNAFFPERTNEMNLGTSSLKWKAVYIGTADSYGSTSSPIYWKAGVPAAVNAKDTCTAFINALGLGDSTPVDADYYISQHVGGGTTNTAYYRRPISTLWSYVKGKADGVYVNVTGDTMSGNLTITHSDTSNSQFAATNSNGTVSLLASTNRGVYDNTNSKWIIYLKVSDSTVRSNYPIYGAVWNDYAEYRKDNPIEKDIQKPGRCVRELGDGSLALTTERLQRGCEIISDTFGFAIGQNKDKGYDTPIASSGRVLAYPYENIEEFKKHIGYCVCSGPNGTVSIMTDEEEEKYPGRIIGIISEVPNYEEWECGTDGKEKIKVNGRIWIRIR